MRWSEERERHGCTGGGYVCRGVGASSTECFCENSGCSSCELEIFNISDFEFVPAHLRFSSSVFCFVFVSGGPSGFSFSLANQATHRALMRGACAPGFFYFVVDHFLYISVCSSLRDSPGTFWPPHRLLKSPFFPHPLQLQR